YGCQVGGLQQGIDELRPRYLTENEALGSNRYMTFAAMAAIDAWNDAGLNRPEAGSDVVDWDSGAIIGSGCGGMDTVTEKIIPLVDARKWDQIDRNLFEQT